ncbi:MAG: cell envelope integrity protein TolA, partial [Acidiferrobacterales bacterium]
KLLIRQKVSRNWARPPGAQTGLQCTVRVRLVPSGDVLQATVAKTSGDERFDRSVENAVYKASPLPLPEDRDLFEYFREIEFIFNPED